MELVCYFMQPQFIQKVSSDLKELSEKILPCFDDQLAAVTAIVKRLCSQKVCIAITTPSTLKKVSMVKRQAIFWSLCLLACSCSKCLTITMSYNHNTFNNSQKHITAITTFTSQSTFKVGHQNGSSTCIFIYHCSIGV